jgi:hypothetical protein
MYPAGKCANVILTSRSCGNFPIRFNECLNGLDRHGLTKLPPATRKKFYDSLIFIISTPKLLISD